MRSSEALVWKISSVLGTNVLVRVPLKPLNAVLQHVEHCLEMTVLGLVFEVEPVEVFHAYKMLTHNIVIPWFGVQYLNNGMILLVRS